MSNYREYETLIKINTLKNKAREKELYKRFKKICKSYGIHLTKGIVLALQLFIEKFGDDFDKMMVSKDRDDAFLVK